MDNNNSFQTSFIPKKPLASSPYAEPDPRHKSVGVLSFLAIVAVVGVIASWVGFYFYKNILLSQIQGRSESLKAAQQSFELETINELQIFDKRMNVSKQILANHVVFTPLFELLNEITIPSIQFTRFEEVRNDEGGKFIVNMKGLARDYRSIAIQSQLFNSDKSKYFKDVVFKNLTLSDDKTEKGYVRFDISFSVDPTLLSYEKNVLQHINSANSIQVNIDESNNLFQMNPSVQETNPVIDNSLQQDLSTPSDVNNSQAIINDNSLVQ